MRMRAHDAGQVLAWLAQPRLAQRLVSAGLRHLRTKPSTPRQRQGGAVSTDGHAGIAPSPAKPRILRLTMNNLLGKDS